MEPCWGLLMMSMGFRNELGAEGHHIQLSSKGLVATSQTPEQRHTKCKHIIIILYKTNIRFILWI